MASKSKYYYVRPQRSCCVVGCSSNEMLPGMHFYRFPGRKWETGRKQAWIDAVNRPGVDNQPWTPKDHTRICSAHFVGGAKSDFQNSESYIPTIFLNSYKMNDGSSKRLEPAPKRTRNDDIIETWTQPAVDPLFEIVTVKCEPMEVETSTIGCQTEPWFDQPINETNVLFCCVGGNESSTQTQIYIQKPIIKQKRIIIENLKLSKDKSCGTDEEMYPSLWRFLDITTDTTMRQLTGISLEFFLTLLNLIVPNHGKQPAYFKKLRKEDRLFLFLLKIKLGVSFCALGSLFHIHSTTASRTFFQILETLTEKTKDWVFWPSRESVRKSLPLRLSRYASLRYILACIEVCTETPASAGERLLMYSVKKETSTIKFLVAVTPDGNLCQTSKGYGGNAEMSFMINDSGFLNILEKGDIVMADKSFSVIESELTKRNVTLVIQQLESEETKNGLVKIHENRAIQKIKLLRVLEHFTMELLLYKESLMHMCCVIANGRPLRKSEDTSTEGPA